MLDALGPSYGGQQSSTDGASAGYRGQIGTRSAWAHAVAHNIEFQAGDVLVSETSAPVWGYNAELERAMIIGEPTDEMRRLFDHTVAARRRRSTRCRPGATCADVDRAVLDYLEANDLLPYWRQHTGHAIGLRNHEAPFLDVGDHTPIEPGMVFTIEPGVYDGELGGFRHSDTVEESKPKLTEDGLVPQSHGWYVVNARETRWAGTDELWRGAWLEPDEPWSGLGFIYGARPGKADGEVPRRVEPGGVPGRGGRVPAAHRR